LNSVEPIYGTVAIYGWTLLFKAQDKKQHKTINKVKTSARQGCIHDESEGQLRSDKGIEVGDVEVGDSSLSKNAVYVVTALWLCA
jgi:hypothetical protein